MLTVQEKIDIGYVCSIYANNEIEGGNLAGGQIDLKLPTLLFCVTSGLEYLYDVDPPNDDLDLIGNYLISICRHAARAQAALAIGGNGEIPSDISGLPQPQSFIVSASSFVPTGATSKTITEWIGFNLLFVRNGIPQGTVPSEPTYYTWDRVTGLFTTNIGAVVDELWFMMPIR